jgi:septum formation protein
MISTLQGRAHHVITAVALFNGKTRTMDTRAVTSTVHFAPMSEKEIDWYLNTGEWQGAAGAYKIQGLAGCFVERIEGSYSSNVGLPLHVFYQMLREDGYHYGA